MLEIAGKEGLWAHGRAVIASGLEASCRGPPRLDVAADGRELSEYS